MLKPWIVCLVLCVLIAFSSPTTVFAASVQLTLISGIDYSEGDYGGNEQIRIISYPLTIKYESHHWISKVQFAGIKLEEEIPASLQQNEETAADIDPRTSKRHTGLGDTRISVARKTTFRFLGDNFVDIGVKAKLPSASESKRLGTGETDWTLQLDGFRAYGNWTPFVTLGYRWRGDSKDQDREDGLITTLGSHHRWNDTWSGGMFLDFSDNSIVDRDATLEWIPYIVYRLNARWQASLYIATGLSETSLDKGGGIQLIYRTAKKTKPPQHSQTSAQN